MPFEFLKNNDPDQDETRVDSTPVLSKILGAYPLSIYLILINVIIFFMMLILDSYENAWKFGSMNYVLIGEKQEFYRFFTALFLHGHEIHIILNMFSLFMVGPFIEHVFGRVNFFVLYMVTGIMGCVASFYINAPDIASHERGVPEAVGASGAIFGIVGGFTIFLIINKTRLVDKIRLRLLKNIALVLVLNLGFGFFSGLPIDNAGHIGGLLAGALLGLFIRPEIFGYQKMRLMKPLGWIFFLLLLISFIWSTWRYISVYSDIPGWGAIFS
ncbi:MAG: rhomboid family intramembrane serine protease [Spirochaetota bacterium]|nr:rhomboid family intramembrane serine protease [Spirochaetota bacterium]